MEVFEQIVVPTDAEKTFCSISSAQGVPCSSSSRVPLEKMPNACGGNGIGQLHCLKKPRVNECDKRHRLATTRNYRASSKIQLPRLPAVKS